MYTGRFEAIVVRDSAGDVEVCSGDGDVVLLVDNQPVTIAWPPDRTTQTRLFFRAFDASDLAARLAGMALCTDGVDPSLPLAVQLKPLLRLLVDGTYDAHLEEMSGMEGDDPGVDEPCQPFTYLEWAGLHRVETDVCLLLGSIPRSLLDPIAIRDVAMRIRAGYRPAIVTLTCAGAAAAFLLHGHVAMEAYQQVGVAPTTLTLTYRTPRRLSVDEATETLRHAIEHFGDIAAAHFQTARDATRRPVTV
jgi:hypothetical protein